MTSNHWAAKETARNRVLNFGAQYGLSGDGILELLGVERINDYDGTEAEAVATVAKWAKEQGTAEPELEPEPELIYDEPTLDVNEEDQQSFFEACAKLPETPAIAWTTFQDAQGFEWSYTIRAGLPAHLASIARQLTAVEIAAFHQDAQAYGWTPLIDMRRGNGGSGAQKAAPALKLVQPGGNGNQTGQFSPQYLEYAGKSGNDSLYWKCKGHPFSQYGVTIWEEALPPELKEVATADLTQDVDLTGWVATYSLKSSKNDPNKLVPDKVVSLTKAA